MDTLTRTDTRIVEIPLAPPRRLLDTLRFKSSKLRYDIEVWDRAMAPAVDLAAAGYAVRAVTVDWGRSEPLTPEARERATRQLTRCYEGTCELSMVASGLGRGSTMIAMTRE